MCRRQGANTCSRSKGTITGENRIMKLGLRALMWASVLAGTTATAVFALDTPTVSVVTQGFGKAVLEVTAGDSGAPNGFTVWWMKESDYIANGYSMVYYPSPIQGAVSYFGVPTLNTWDGTLTSFVLAPNQTVKVEVGDTDDETGVWTNISGELEPGIAYMFCASANADQGIYDPASGFSSNQNTWTLGGQDCTYTQGYWKTHGLGDCHNGNNLNEWPVTSLTLGTVLYTDTQLCAILNEPTAGNGLISLCHQLITTKLNIANGSDPSAIAATVAAADAQIGNLVCPPVGGGFLAPGQTASKTQTLDDYNNGVIGPGHCGPTSVDASTWGSIKGLYR
jgi:hypothetical protein